MVKIRDWERLPRNQKLIDPQTKKEIIRQQITFAQIKSTPKKKSDPPWEATARRTAQLSN